MIASYRAGNEKRKKQISWLLILTCDILSTAEPIIFVRSEDGIPTPVKISSALFFLLTFYYLSTIIPLVVDELIVEPPLRYFPKVRLPRHQLLFIYLTVLRKNSILTSESVTVSGDFRPIAVGFVPAGSFFVVSFTSLLLQFFNFFHWNINNSGRISTASRSRIICSLCIDLLGIFDIMSML